MEHQINLHYSIWYEINRNIPIHLFYARSNLYPWQHLNTPYILQNKKKMIYLFYQHFKTYSN